MIPVIILSLAAIKMTEPGLSGVGYAIKSLISNRERYAVDNQFGPLVFMDWSPPIPLLISEVMFNPAGKEPEAEWVELYNYGLGELDLNLKIGDSDTSGDYEGMYLFPLGATIQSREVIVIANQSMEFETLHGFKPDFEFNDSDPTVPDLVRDQGWSHGNLNLRNSGDELILMSSANVIIDMVSWGDSNYAFSPGVPLMPEDHSIERYPPNLDTDSAYEWRDQPAPAPGMVDITPPPTRTPLPATATVSPSQTQSNTSTSTTTATLTAIFPASSTPSTTPTSPATSTLTPTWTPTTTPSGSAQPVDHLLVSEVLYNPYNLEPQNEWIEIYNPTLDNITLDDYKIGDEESFGGNEGMLRFPSGYSISPEERIVIANDAALFMDSFGYPPDFEINDSVSNVPEMLVYLPWADGIIFLDNQGDEVLLIGPGDNLIDALSWGTSTWAFDPPCLPVPEGHSLERYPEYIDTDMAEDWIDEAVPDPGHPE